MNERNTYQHKKTQFKIVNEIKTFIEQLKTKPWRINLEFLRGTKRNSRKREWRE